MLLLLIALAAGPAAAVAQAPSELTWTESKVLPGARQAVLGGDPDFHRAEPAAAR